MKHKKAVHAAMVLSASILISGCAPIISGVMNASTSQDDVALKTAKYFGTSRENITISGIDKGALTTSYQAKVTDKNYACSIYYGEVGCKQSGTQPGGAMEPAPAANTALGAASPSIAGQQITVDDRQMSALQAQTRLNQLGYAVGTPDGIFGKKTAEKLKLFQKSRGLPVSGKLDEATITALR